MSVGTDACHHPPWAVAGANPWGMRDPPTAFIPIDEEQCQAGEGGGIIGCSYADGLISAWCDVWASVTIQPGRYLARLMSALATKASNRD